jgi:hypothetical protein
MRALSPVARAAVTGISIVVLLASLAAAMLLLRGGQGGTTTIDPGDGGDYRVTLDPSAFVSTIDNPWLPFSPGSRWVYEDHAAPGGTRIEVVVTDGKRPIVGIQATVVRVTETLDGRVVEDTFDWYAQDGDGNVWYLGEDTTASRVGQAPSSAGSWEAGVDGALPGIVMKANPQIGDAYRQEYYPGRAEDMAEVIRTDHSLTVPFGTLDDVLVTREWSPLEPGVVEEKFYAMGVGLVRERHVQGGSGGADLVTYEPAG